MQYLLEKAISIALAAHKGQVDKGGGPYILHPLRVMLSVETLNEKIVAVLHDVVEDSDITIDELRLAGFNEAILDAVQLLTRENVVSYEDYIKNMKSNSLAVSVKKADLNDNMNMARLYSPNNSDSKRLEKYKRALQVLTDKS